MKEFNKSRLVLLGVVVSVLAYIVVRAVSTIIGDFSQLGPVSLMLIGLMIGLSFAQLLIDHFFDWLSARSKRLKSPSGTRLMSIVTFLYSPADVEKVFEPTLADWRKEYFDALAAQRRWKARWINVRYRYRFALAMGLSKGWKLIDLALQVVRSAISKS